MKRLEEVNFSGKKVFLRADFNVPIDKEGNVTDDTRIRATLPTIQKILKDGGCLVVASHLGRPKGKASPEFSLLPVAKALSNLLSRAVPLAPDCIGDETYGMVEALKEGELLMLENLRFHPEEEKNDPSFAKALARGIDIYVNDAFAVSHRAHASVHAIVRFVPVCVAGYQLQQELDYYHRTMEDPQRPMGFVIGGAKVSTKIGVLENLLPRCDLMIIGGAMANTFLKALGKPVGRSMIEEEYIDTAKSFLEKAKARGVEILLPEDVVVAPSEEAEPEACRKVAVDNVPNDVMIFDVGEATIAKWREALSRCKTIVWNGPVGMFEKPQFSKGTMDLARFISSLKTLTVAGGGDTVSALHQAGTYDKMSYVSTGGGAFLEMLEGRELPGVAALKDCGKGFSQ
ncbi:MAG: phosphoglycerate kinase [Syntrophobacterales bacterium]|nr:phosphoglycerate kinase [Syntrophobacterales bacterium]